MSRTLETKFQKRRRERHDRVERIMRKRDKIAMLRALLEHYEQCSTKDAANQCTLLSARIRTLEQEVRYIGESP